MIRILRNANIALIGGGNFCKALLQLLFSGDFDEQCPKIVGVASLNRHSVGAEYAREKGIFITTDFRHLYTLESLDLILELTKDNALADKIRKEKPSHIRLLDHFSSGTVWDALRIEQERIIALRKLRDEQYGPEKTEAIFEKFARNVAKISWERNEYSQKIEWELVEHERAVSQIVEGSTIPTFVINKDHIVTHWNRALEKLSGCLAKDIVGTNKQWVPFYQKERPTMADVMLDQIEEDGIRKLYGETWKKSVLIKGACEAEAFLRKLGENGKWCWFTAAPIKSPDGTIIGAIETLWDKTEEKEAREERIRHECELAESEKAMSQIIQGSMIPTFVINKNHMVTHWNKALEKMTGLSAKEIVGTNKHWMPFRSKERPSMADAILDQFKAGEINKYYGLKWRKSNLVKGAYEAEEFFPHLGENGKWCWFTAAPIKAPDGTIVGAIETLWDKTEEKKAQEERERHTQELTALCSIYTALSTSLGIEARLNAAIKEIQNLLSLDCVTIFLLGEDGLFHIGQNYDTEECIYQGDATIRQNSVIYRVAESNELRMFEDIPEGSYEEIGLTEPEAFKSLAYIPISAKEKKVMGVIRIGSKKSKHFSTEEKRVLELIGNRIGITIENSMLHEQYIRSEEKYRSLFNNDPNPIFIIDSKRLKILDTNQRAESCYGYSKQELFGMPFLKLGDENDEELGRGLKTLSKDHSVLFSKKRHYRKGRIPFYVNINASYAEYHESDVLVATTTDVTESVEKDVQLIQASKMTTLGTMAAGMAHEINQPLNVIQVCADFFTKMIKKGVPISKEDMESVADDISSNVERAAGIIRHMRDFARQSEVVRTKVNLNDPIQDVFKVLGHQLKVHNIELRLDLDPDLPLIMAEHNRLEQVFINLVTNAVDAIDEKGEALKGQHIDRRMEISSFTDNGQVVAVVSDTGTGMPREVIDKIFEPFFTTKEVGRGTGLGVSISYGIVKDYEGTIDIRSEVGQGTTFEIRFPVFLES